ncbi:MAG: hypothetical protein HY453_00685 [Parcubacteria group bacterium]|nr:hypothetical protein [Parcubacteria group bacterium]
MSGAHTTVKTKKNLAWIVSADMGYGHERAAHPLRYLALDEVLTANNYEGITAKDEKLWRQSRGFYEFVSRFKRVPFFGEMMFDAFDRLQSIPSFYPQRDLSAPNMQVRAIYRLLKKGWLKSLVEKMNRRPLPMITTFFVTALAADYFGYQGEIYCIVTDTDMSRAWVALDPKRSRIQYFAPTERVVKRLQLYGVPRNKIFLTGFPLPKENIGGKNLRILKKDLAERLFLIDPQKRFLSKYKDTVATELGLSSFMKKPDRPLTVTFAVGGAGAQRELGRELVYRFRHLIAKGKMKLVLVAGVKNEVYHFFRESFEFAGLKKCFGNCADILYATDKEKYFAAFNALLRKTDILWTKPSELSFYSGLGIPIIMAPSIGAQENFNREWLKAVGAGITQKDPTYADEWLMDWLDSGWLAKAAFEGFLYAPKMGTYNIEEILIHKKLKLEMPSLIY